MCLVAARVDRNETKPESVELQKKTDNMTVQSVAHTDIMPGFSRMYVENDTDRLHS